MPQLPLHSRARRSARLRRGFSFIELLMVFSVMAIVGSLTMGKIADWTAQSRVERATQAINQDLKSAFAIARRNNEPVLVRFEKWSAGDSVRLRLTNRTGTTVFRTRYLGLTSPYALKASEFVHTDTVFQVFPMGLAENGITVTINRNGVQRRVIMTRAGLSTVHK